MYRCQFNHSWHIQDYVMTHTTKWDQESLMCWFSWSIAVVMLPLKRPKDPGGLHKKHNNLSQDLTGSKARWCHCQILSNVTLAKIQTLSKLQGPHSLPVKNRGWEDWAVISEELWDREISSLCWCISPSPPPFSGNLLAIVLHFFHSSSELFCFDFLAVAGRKKKGGGVRTADGENVRKAALNVFLFCVLYMDNSQKQNLYTLHFQWNLL